MQVNWISLFLLTASTLSIGSGVYVFYKTGLKGRNYFALAFFSMGIWALTNSLELLTDPLPLKIFLTKLSYVGIVTSVPLLFFFTCSYTGRERYLELRWQLIVMLVPVLILFSAFTNELHFLQWVSYTIKDSIAGDVVIYGSGPGVFIIAFYSYMLLTVSYVFLIKHLTRNHRYYHKQLFLLLISLLIPWLLNITYITRINPYPEFDFAPVGLFFSSAIILVAILRYQLFTLLPQAKEILFDFIPDPIIVIDTRFVITDINPAAEKVIAGKNIVTQKIYDILPGIQIVEGLIPAAHLEYYYPGKGDDYWFFITISEIRSRDGELGGYLLLLHDITRRKMNEEILQKSENKLRELNASKDKFFSIIAHDLKNPFSNIINISRILEEDDEKMTQEERLHFIRLLSKVSRSSYELLENLLQWSRSQTDSLQYSPQEILLLDIFRRAYNDVKFYAANKNITIVFPEHAVGMVYGDPNLISVVFRNLLMNAVKFSYPGGQIELNYVTEEEYIILTVKDYGTGIQPEIRKNLFRLDYQTSRRGTANEQGTGLGLVLCKEFVEKNKGELWVESTEGKGSEFFVKLLKAELKT